MTAGSLEAPSAMKCKWHAHKNIGNKVLSADGHILFIQKSVKWF